MSRYAFGNFNADVAVAQRYTTGPFSANDDTVKDTALKAVFKPPGGTTADYADLVAVKVVTLAANSPQEIDLSSLTGLRDEAQTWMKVVGIAIRWASTTDGVPLLVGGSTSNAWLGLVADATDKIKVYSSTTANAGFAVFTAPNTTAMAVDSTHKMLKLDPQTAAGDVSIYLLGRSA